ncbi:MAG: hypothetical protein AAB289_15450 [Chloroflexota bacterium]
MTPISAARNDRCRTSRPGLAQWTTRNGPDSDEQTKHQHNGCQQETKGYAGHYLTPVDHDDRGSAHITGRRFLCSKLGMDAVAEA